VRVFDARDQGSFILVMEYIEGVSLRQLLERLARAGTHLPVAAALQVASSMASALEYAHQAVDEWGRPLALVHGDMSPHNILMGVDGRVKLMDFGLSRAHVSLTERPPNRISGKYGYLAPETVFQRETTQSSDLFGLGVVLWECLTGKRLFNAHDIAESSVILEKFDVPAPSRLNPSVTAAIDELVLGLVARDISDRFPDASALRSRVELVLTGIEDLCLDTSARLVQLALGTSHEPKMAASEVVRLSEQELEEFFANAKTTLFHKPSLPPVAEGVFEAFVAECDTGLIERP